MFNQIKDSIESAIKALQAGKPVIVIDDYDRENEGDLLAVAETITPEIINFMATHCRGLICTPLTESRCRELELTAMVTNNTESMKTAFTVSIDVKGYGTTTGISAYDRAQTVKALVNHEIKADELARPGHIFPLIAQDGGVLRRPGHTEAMVDLARLAGFKPAGVICEIMKDDGTMMRTNDLQSFAKKHDLLLLTIADLYQYRLATELFVEKTASSKIPFDGVGELDMAVYKDKFSDNEVIVLSKEYKGDNPLVRIHSSCITGDLFGSLRCDCQSQLKQSMKMISEEGGLLIYLDQEGRGIGLANKLKAYNLQMNESMDTIEANVALGLDVDSRKYDLATQVLKYNKIEECRLITNNPKKAQALEIVGIKTSCVSCKSFVNEHNKEYLETKRDKMQHTITGI
jgi:3,4-dihydroxy 2-butanone 4-phosphate synthase/GTP cyclohydrolase II